MRLLPTLLVCALLGCAGDRPAADRPTDATDGGERTARDRAQADAIASCRQAFADVANASDLSVAVTGLLTACADLHRAPACREAWRTAATVSPEMRISVLAAGCQRAYCPSLPTPRPALCDREVAALAPTELGPAWAELERVILVRELGRDAGGLFADGLSRLGTPIVVEVPPSPPPAPTTEVTLVVKLEGQTLVVSRLDDPARRATIPADADAAATAPRLAPLLAGVDRVVLAADASLSYALVIRVLDALRQAGITRFAVAVEPAPSP